MLARLLDERGAPEPRPPRGDPYAILAVGDLGIRRAVERAYALPGLPSAAEVTAIAEPWRPYRTAACLLLWHSLDNAPA